RTELCELFGRGLVPQHSHCGIAGNKLDQQGDQRDNGPNHEHEKAQATEHSEDFALHQDVVEFPTADDSRMSLRAAIAEPYGEWGKTNVARREPASSATRPRQPYYRLASPTDYVVLVDCPGGPNQVVGANYLRVCGCFAPRWRLRYAARCPEWRAATPPVKFS